MQDEEQVEEDKGEEEEEEVPKKKQQKVSIHVLKVWHCNPIVSIQTRRTAKSADGAVENEQQQAGEDQDRLEEEVPKSKRQQVSIHMLSVPLYVIPIVPSDKENCQVCR